MRATSFDDFRRAMRGWGAPSANQVYADVTGRIAWLPVGLTPIRPNWTGLLPVPGDGRYEWDGFLDPAEMPELVDPPEGFVATANEMNLPADWDHAAKAIGYEWVEPSRASRIREALGAPGLHDLAASQALQTDTASMPARRVLAVTQGVDLGPAGEFLRNWNTRLEADSGPAALFELWWTKHLKPALLAAVCPDPALRKLLLPGDVESLLGLIETPGGRLPVRDALLRDTLEAAWADAEQRLGPDPSVWRWGALHHGYFEHALSPLGRSLNLDAGPLPKGGSGSTPMHAGYRPSDFRVIAGAPRCASSWMSRVGQQRLHQHARTVRRSALDPLPRPRAALGQGEYLPLLYSRAGGRRGCRDRDQAHAGLSTGFGATSFPRSQRRRSKTPRARPRSGNVTVAKRWRRARSRQPCLRRSRTARR